MIRTFGDAVWIDSGNPDKDEETAVERALGIDVPTIEEMSEIEISSRLYSDDGAHFMTAMVLSHTDGYNGLPMRWLPGSWKGSSAGSRMCRGVSAMSSIVSPAVSSLSV